jgi:hypothetical protein
MTGLDYIMHGSPMLSANYSAERTFLLTEGAMSAGASWSYFYEAADASMGGLWTAEGTYTVVGPDKITISAGTFDALVIENDYKVIDTSKFGMFDREVVATMYFVERLGMVYTEEVDAGGGVVEIRELSSYSGFYP